MEFRKIQWNLGKFKRIQSIQRISSEFNGMEVNSSQFDGIEVYSI